VLSIEEEAVVVAFRRHTLLPLDDCLYALQATIPHLTLSSLHRCLQRHGIARLPDTDGDKPRRSRFKTYPIGFFHIDIAEVHTEKGRTPINEEAETKAEAYWAERDEPRIYRLHAFESACEKSGIEHRLTKPRHPWTTDEVEQPPSGWNALFCCRPRATA
jgi:hypothetical protein